MKKFSALLGCCSLALSLCACQSGDNYSLSDFSDLVIDSKVIYLVGEMNDYKPSAAFALKKEGDDRYCAISALRSDLGPYRFKFADENWSKGTNFGFENPPGSIREGSGPVALNGDSRFEDMKFYPQEDGLYSFCMIKNNGRFYASVSSVDKKELVYLANYIALTKNRP